MTYIYCFDLSLNSTGITLFSNDALPFLVTSIDTKSEKEHQRKLKIIAEKLIDMKKFFEPELVIIERGFSLHNTSTQAIFKVFGLVQYLFYDIPQIFISPSTVKKVITGKGNSDKEQVRKVLEKKYHVEFNNNDESDSFGLGICYFLGKGIIT